MANKILEGKEKERSKDDKTEEGGKRRRGWVYCLLLAFVLLTHIYFSQI